MRKIIFRGRDSNDNWHYGDLEHSPIGKFCRIHMYWGNGLYKGQVDVSMNTVGQFTGMHDMSGTPIYEGDIIRSELLPPMEVYYDDGTAKFMVRNSNRSTWTAAIGEYAGTVTVIGNVYDNPDLLEGGAQ